MVDPSSKSGQRADDQEIAKILFWMLSPLTLLGAAFLLFGISALFEPPHAPGWEGEEFGHPNDWFGPCLFSSLLLYTALGIFVWSVLAALAFNLNEELFIKASTVWLLLFFFNAVAIAYWVFLTIYFKGPTYGVAGGGTRLFPVFLVPMVVNIPALVVAAKRLKRLPASVPSSKLM